MRKGENRVGRKKDTPLCENGAEKGPASHRRIRRRWKIK